MECYKQQNLNLHSPNTAEQHCAVLYYKQQKVTIHSPTTTALCSVIGSRMQSYTHQTQPFLSSGIIINMICLSARLQFTQTPPGGGASVHMTHARYACSAGLHFRLSMGRQCGSLTTPRHVHFIEHLGNDKLKQNIY